MARKSRKGTKPVRNVNTLAKRATTRQRRLYGANGAQVPPHDRGRVEIDAKYAADLARDPKARLWLSIFNEEYGRCRYLPKEPHLHTLEQIQEMDRERKARAANQDVLSYGAHRGPSLEALGELRDERPGDVEDELIARIDRRRSLVLRKGGLS